MPFHGYLKECFEDIEYLGIVYYPHFHNYFHVAFEEFFSGNFEIDSSTIQKKHKLGFPAVH